MKGKDIELRGQSKLKYSNLCRLNENCQNSMFNHHCYFLFKIKKMFLRTKTVNPSTNWQSSYNRELLAGLSNISCFFLLLRTTTNHQGQNYLWKICNLWKEFLGTHRNVYSFKKCNIGIRSTKNVTLPYNVVEWK